MSLVVLSIPTILIKGNIGLQDIENGSSPSSQDYMISVLSNSFALLLVAVYFLRLIFVFKTHKHLFGSQEASVNDAHEVLDTYQENRTINFDKGSTWSKKKSIGILAVSMIGKAVVSEILVGSIEKTTEILDLGVLFVGAIVIGIAGNVPKKSLR